MALIDAAHLRIAFAEALTTFGCALAALIGALSLCGAGYSWAEAAVQGSPRPPSYPEFPGPGLAMQAVTVGVIAFKESVGPLLSRRGLERAGEIGSAEVLRLSSAVVRVADPTTALGSFLTVGESRGTSGGRQRRNFSGTGWLERKPGQRQRAWLTGLIIFGILPGSNRPAALERHGGLGYGEIVRPPQFNP
jgi:hypothetical protein